jgi:hypothetical protein
VCIIVVVTEWNLLSTLCVAATPTLVWPQVDELMAGLLRDKYLSDLRQRLRLAEWKVSLAQERAATWGWKYLVPLGRSGRFAKN